MGDSIYSSSLISSSYSPRLIHTSVIQESLSSLSGSLIEANLTCFLSGSTVHLFWFGSGDICNTARIGGCCLSGGSDTGGGAEASGGADASEGGSDFYGGLL